jgi:hypothetical protein
MRIRHDYLLTTGLTGLTGIWAGAIGAQPAAAATADVTVTLPQLKVAEFHKPYVAIFLEQPGQPTARTLAVWYDFDNRENGGTKWLRDLRSWWRESGRSLNLPADGISGATRAPGPQKATVDLGQLAPGDYVLAVEAAREEGGHEIVRVPFKWSGKPIAKLSGAGSAELGAIVATVRP